MTHDNLRIAFDERGLVPVVVQDAASGQVLMVAWMNEEALRLTLETGHAHFWSRSRRELWHKGATSGNVMHVRDMRVDCDADTLLLQVDPAGPACHTGERSCFFRPLVAAPKGATTNGIAPSGDPPLVVAPSGASRPLVVAPKGATTNGIAPSDDPPLVVAPSGASRRDAQDSSVLHTLFATILDRQANPSPGSYTARLLEAGEDEILKKVGEEAMEVILAAKGQGDERLVAEVADLLYHLLVLLAARGLTLADIETELLRRRR